MTTEQHITVSRAPALGDVLEGRWLITGMLGRGGHAGVYRGTHAFLRYPVAIKTLSVDPRSAIADDLRARLLTEAEIGARVRHPNVLKIFDVGRTPSGEPYLVMELVEGETLRDRLDHGALPIGQAVDVARQILGGLGALAEHGIVHRDVKPSNIMLKRSARGVRAKLIDLGVARRLPPATGGHHDDPVEGFLVGTPSYMAPEQLRARAVDARADVYSAGVVLYECLTGRVPPRPTFVERYAVEPELAIDALPAVRLQRPECPAWLESVVRRATAIDRDQRYPSAAAMTEALAVLARDLALPSGARAWIEDPTRGPVRTLATRGADERTTRHDGRSSEQRRRQWQS
jgi:serine/threonine protein kinase